MTYGDKLDGGGDDLDAGSAGTQSTGTRSTGTQSTGTQPTGNYWPAGEDYWPAAETGWRRLGDAGSGEPDEAPYDYEDGQP
ncbi:MAG TPA: hypothetical protein VK586_17375 [Streptosporangiaceae bacterium]|nr:hypothetical protein [Streptosporangiaceae bacterium]